MLWQWPIISPIMLLVGSNQTGQCLLFPAHFPSQTRPEVVWLALVGLLLSLALNLAIQRSCFGFGPLRRAAMGRILYVHGSVVFSEGNVWVGKMRIVGQFCYILDAACARGYFQKIPFIGWKNFVKQMLLTQWIQKWYGLPKCFNSIDYNHENTNPRIPDVTRHIYQYIH